MWLKMIKNRVMELKGLPWKPGHGGGSIVNQKKEKGKNYYGGRLVCESCCGPELRFIINAPTDVKKLLEYCEQFDVIFTALRWKENDERAPDIGQLVVRLVAACRVACSKPILDANFPDPRIEAQDRIAEIVDASN